MSYYPYGEEKGTTTEQGRDKYGTYHRDEVTGLDYAVNRYYGSGLGRFLSADPYQGPDAVKDLRGWNRYAYVEADPVNFNDASGLDRDSIQNYARCMRAPLQGEWSWNCGGRSGRKTRPHLVGEDSKVVPKVKRKKRIIVENPSKSGANQSLILDTLGYLLANLDEDCRGFLGGGVEEYVRGLIGDRSNADSAYIAHGVLQDMPNIAAATGGDASEISTPAGYAAVIVNDKGAFFNSGFVVSNGRLQGGTAEAQRSILLHEIGHGLNKLEPDRGNQGAVDRNDQSVWDNCKKTIER